MYNIQEGWGSHAHFREDNGQVSVFCQELGLPIPSDQDIDDKVEYRVGPVPIRFRREFEGQPLLQDPKLNRYVILETGKRPAYSFQFPEVGIISHYVIDGYEQFLTDEHLQVVRESQELERVYRERIDPAIDAARMVNKQLPLPI